MSQEHPGPARSIKAVKQLLVEGRTSEIFFREWVSALKLQETVQIWSFGSITNLTGFLKHFAGRPEFRELVAALGIVRDAEAQSVNDVFASVCSSLTQADLERLLECGRFSEGKLRTGVFILPDCAQRGMLETLCWSTLETKPRNKPHLACVEAHIDCLRRSAIAPANLAKAKVWMYLAGLVDFDPQVGRAAQAKVWDWESPALAQMAQFLKAL